MAKKKETKKVELKEVSRVEINGNINYYLRRWLGKDYSGSNYADYRPGI